MRKPRDYNAELKALHDKARQLKARKQSQLGELVQATGAEELTIEELAGAFPLLSLWASTFGEGGRTALCATKLNVRRAMSWSAESRPSGSTCAASPRAACMTAEIKNACWLRSIRDTRLSGLRGIREFARADALATPGNRRRSSGIFHQVFQRSLLLCGKRPQWRRSTLRRSCSTRLPPCKRASLALRQIQSISSMMAIGPRMRSAVGMHYSIFSDRPFLLA